VVLLDPVAALREVVPQMRADGAQVVILLSHLFHEETERVVQEVDGIDVALGSHLGPRPVGYLTEPQVVNGAILSVAGENMSGLGQLELTIRDGRVAAHTFRRHVPTPTGPVDAAVQTVLDSYRAGR
jgi:2',3'-cyclic-nucleotide 2'-phosphodiesterase (5'-nucleotidase family)